MVKSQMWARAANKQASNSSNTLPRNGITKLKSIDAGYLQTVGERLKCKLENDPLKFVYSFVSLETNKRTNVALSKQGQ